MQILSSVLIEPTKTTLAQQLFVSKPILFYHANDACANGRSCLNWTKLIEGGINGSTPMMSTLIISFTKGEFQNVSEIRRCDRLNRNIVTVHKMRNSIPNRRVGRLLWQYVRKRDYAFGKAAFVRFSLLDKLIVVIGRHPIIAPALFAVDHLELATLIIDVAIGFISDR
jgi:hypothetical protein